MVGLEHDGDDRGEVRAGHERKQDCDGKHGGHGVLRCDRAQGDRREEEVGLPDAEDNDEGSPEVEPAEAIKAERDAPSTTTPMSDGCLASHELLACHDGSVPAAPRDSSDSRPAVTS